MISHAANAHHFGTEITADGGKISMHPWPYVQTNPRLTIFRAKDDMNDYSTERLGHCGNDGMKRRQK